MHHGGKICLSICFVYDRRRHKLPAVVQRAIIPRFLRTSTAGDDDSEQTSATEPQTAPSAAVYNDLQPGPHPQPIYAKPQKQKRSAASSSSALDVTDASGPSSTAGNNGLQARTHPPPIYAKLQKRSPASPGVAPGITDGNDESSAAGNNGLQPKARPPPVYTKPNKRSPVSPPPPSAANGQSSVYNGTSTTLIDNKLYERQQQPVTSSNVAEPDDDLTVIDNDLYAREGQGQQNSGSTDYECTLIDNDLYR